MDQERQRRVRVIADRALHLSAGERPEFLDDACGDDPEVRAEVERLLEARASAPGPATEASATYLATFEAGGAARGERSIGPYRLLRILGEGGMGVVWEAEQERPLHRRVALKVIKHSFDGERVLARFEAERQALSLMDHPNVARVLDAGSAEDGRPYFVMDLIQGISITDYCDRHLLGPRERLELMVQVCEGVQHAHQKGVIHRDLKPSNILVEIREGKPLPRIIDFGVAKATERYLTERARFTEFGEIIGTPEYMSPEQAEMTPLDIDTRTDVYSLGVILYELLVGVLPFDPQELRRAGFDEMRRRIREETPHAPSTRLISLGARSGAVAQHRKTDPQLLARLCRGDLDWITMKALDKDRTRRYASASDLAADLERHLANEPVSAGPPSVGYRARKFVRRHRVGVAFAATLGAALVIGFGGTAWGLYRALRAEAATRLEAETVQQVSDFMVGLFEIVDPSEARGREVTAKEVLDRGAVRIRGDLAQKPVLQARLMETLGKVYRSLGLYADAKPLLEEAIAAQSRAHGPEHPAVASVRTTLAGLLIKEGRSDEALPMLEQALALQEKALPPGDLELMRTLTNLGNAYRLQGRDEEALSCLERALAIRERAVGPEHPDLTTQLSNLGAVRLRMQDLDGARRDFERALAIRERAYGPDHVDVARILDNLATLYKETGDLARASETAHRALAIEERHLGPDHPELVNTLINLGLIERAGGNLAASEERLRRALAIARQRFAPGQRDRTLALQELATTLRAAGKADEAAALDD